MTMKRRRDGPGGAHVTAELRAELMREALTPQDRLGVGALIGGGHKPAHVAELVHLLCMAMERLLEEQREGKMVQGKIAKVKAEISRCYALCEKALR